MVPPRPAIDPDAPHRIPHLQPVTHHLTTQPRHPYPWAQTIVTVGLLRVIHGRWACLPLAFAFYLRARTVRQEKRRVHGQRVVFATKYAQAVARIQRLAAVFTEAPILVIADSGFGNNGLWQPLTAALGQRAQLLSRLRVNSVLYEHPAERTPGTSERPRKYGKRLGSATLLGVCSRVDSQTYTVTYTVPLYGKHRAVEATDRVVLLKTLHTAVRVVWVYRKNQWIVLFTTDLDLSVPQIIEYYGASDASFLIFSPPKAMQGLYNPTLPHCSAHTAGGSTARSKSTTWSGRSSSRMRATISGDSSVRFTIRLT